MHPAKLSLFALLAVACATRGKSPFPSPHVERAAGIASPDASFPPEIKLRFRGVNLSGGEFGALPGVYDRDYKYPSSADVDYFLARGMNFLRVPFRHERLQPTLRSDLNALELTRLDALVSYATSRGATVAIEPHDSFRHKGRIVTEIELGDFWGRVARHYATNPRVWFNLTNEPHDMTSERVAALDNAAIREIRRVGAANKILAPGNGWTGAGHWSASWYGHPNATAMLGVTDPLGNTAFEVHMYLDPDAAGKPVECVSASIGVERLTGFVSWLRANKREGFLGEIAAPDTPTCREAVTRALSYVERSYDVFVGWAWWGAGVWSFATTYPLSIGPSTEPKPQLGWLTPMLPSCVAR